MVLFKKVNTYHKSFLRFNNVPASVPLINVAGWQKNSLTSLQSNDKGLYLHITQSFLNIMPGTTNKTI